MSNIIILIIEDEREVLDALVRDLDPFAELFAIEPAESVDEARQVVRSSLDHGKQLGLVLADHLMPGTKGVDFLIELNRDARTAPARKVLVTAQAGLVDTIKAVNDADLDHYIAKPWTVPQLHDVVRRQLSDFVIERQENLLPFMKLLDTQLLMEAMRQRGTTSGIGRQVD
jgi:response regulator RpfG family c-di-GMP phosphodiesterase